MDRGIVYPGAIPQDSDILNINRRVMIALGYLAQAVMGTNVTVVDGLAAIPTSPATLTVNIGQGSIFSLQTIDANSYGSLSSDSNPLLKIGINPEGVTAFTMTAPTTSGFSQNYLIEAAFEEQDTGLTTLPYYNSANPSQPYSGPGNSGTPQNTLRSETVQLQMLSGTPATTGTQTTPAVTAGWVGLYIVTVNFGQTQITSTSIAVHPAATFLGGKMIQTAVEMTTLADVGAVNAYAVSTALLPAHYIGIQIQFKAGHTNTGASTFTDGNGVASLLNPDGSALIPGQIQLNGIYTVTWNGSNYQLTSTTYGTASQTYNPGGFLNKDRNSALDIWKRGISGSVSSGTTAYTADGWVVSTTGAACAWSQTTGLNKTTYALKLTGASGLTDVVVRKRVESFIAAALAGTNVTFQMRVQNNSGGSITPTVTIRHLNTSDIGVGTPWTSPSATTDVSAATLQTIANNQTGVLAYTYSAPAGTANGIEIAIDFGTSLNNTNNIVVCEFDVRATPGVAAGQNNGPPPVELRPVSIEAPVCSRYLPAFTPGSGSGLTTGAMQNTTGSDAPINFQVPARVIPGGITVSSAGHFTMHLFWRKRDLHERCHIQCRVYRRDAGLF